MLKTNLLLIRTLTPLHVGSGRSSRAVDLPVQRDPEELPLIPSTSIRGVFRSILRTLSIDDSSILGDHIGEIAHLGIQPNPGKIFLTDAYLLLYPIHHNGKTIYLTSRYCISRALKIISLAKKFTIPLDDLADKDFITIKLGNEIIRTSFKTSNRLEDSFNMLLKMFSVENYENIVKNIRIIEDKNRILTKIVNSFNIRTYRIAMKNELYLLKKVEEGALWCEEYVPKDTFFICAIAYTKDVEKTVKDILNKLYRGVVQLGGRETIGKGFCRIYFDKHDKNTYKDDKSIDYHN
ncbi:MAG: type III-B CRISPR module RAMP protein Cmr4 [Crenarchaeota archaeon]|nr:type III-B CRISPR module RAMP protein Cmr4 [Thermoproteota archaeon]